jgi:hypothetical protein
MNRSIARWIRIGLIAAVPSGGVALAQMGGIHEQVPRDTGNGGINPVPDRTLGGDTRTDQQQRASDIDQTLEHPPAKPRATGLGQDSSGSSVGNRSDTTGTSGSSGATTGKKSNQAGSQMSGSAGSVDTTPPSGADTHREPGVDTSKPTDLDREVDKTQSDDVKPTPRQGRTPPKSQREPGDVRQDRGDVGKPDRGQSRGSGDFTNLDK